MPSSTRDRSPALHAGPSKQAGLLLAGAIALGAAALVVRVKTRRAEQDHPPLGRFVDVDGVRLHYVERGSGQPLVLLHGNGSMVEDFVISGLFDRAATRYRVIAFDRPGHGHSERPPGTSATPEAQAKLLHAALQRLGVERPVVVGHSWGTLVALALALDHPADVRSLVLLSGYYFPTLRADVPFAAGPAIPVLGTLMRYTISPLLGRMIWPPLKKALFGPAPVPPRFDEFPIWMTLRPSQLKASATESALMVPAARTLSRRYRELDMPVMIMAGAGDRFANAARHSARLHDAIPQSELRIVEGLGHMIHQLVPDDVLAAIDDAAAAATTSAAPPALATVPAR